MDIVKELDDACTLSREKRDLERLCGNAKAEIIRLRKKLADYTCNISAPDPYDQQSLLQSEAEAILCECMDAKNAEKFASDWEVLMEDRGKIVHLVCDKRLWNPMYESAHAEAVGKAVISMVFDAAIKRAKFEFDIAK